MQNVLILFLISCVKNEIDQIPVWTFAQSPKKEVITYYVDEKIYEQVQTAEIEWEYDTNFDIFDFKEKGIALKSITCQRFIRWPGGTHTNVMRMDGFGNVEINDTYCDQFGLAGARHALGHLMGLDDDFEHSNAMSPLKILIEIHSKRTEEIYEGEKVARKLLFSE